VPGHVGINVPDLAAARRYYSAIMPRVGFERCLDADDEFAYRPLAGKPGTYLFFYPSAEQSRYSRHQAGLQHLASMVRFMGSPPVRQSPPGTSTGLVPASGTGSSTAVRNPAAGWRC